MDRASILVLPAALLMAVWIAFAVRTSAAGVSVDGSEPPAQVTTVPPATSTPFTLGADRDPLLGSAGSAIVELRRALAARGAGPDDVDAIAALRFDATHTLGSADEGDETWPRGAWLVDSSVGRWWVWGLDTATPADERARQWDDYAAERRASGG